MKKYLIASSLLLGSFTSPLFSEETNSFYFSVGGGVNFIGDVEGELGGDDFSYATNSPFQYSFAIGKELGDWRLEFNYSALTISSDSITVIPAGQNAVTAAVTPDVEADVTSYMIYGYKDLVNTSKLTPYIGVGVGYSSFEVAAQNIDVGGTNVPLERLDEQLLTFGVKGGLEYEIAESTSLYSEVSYLNLASFDPVEDEKYDSTNAFTVGAGLRFSF